MTDQKASSSEKPLEIVLIHSNSLICLLNLCRLETNVHYSPQRAAGPRTNASFLTRFLLPQVPMHGWLLHLQQYHALRAQVCIRGKTYAAVVQGTRVQCAITTKGARRLHGLYV